MAKATNRRLPAGAEVRVLAPANLLATKLEAFSGRGKGDYLASPDFEDIVALIDGREELADEVHAASTALRVYAAAQLSQLLSEARATEAMAAHLQYGGGGPERARRVIVPRIEQIVAAAR